MGKLKHDLFELIKSLDRNEKGYFKKYTHLPSSGSNRSNNYIRLFDAIDAMEEYDEEKLKDKFKGENFVKQLFVLKNYLYENILKSLRLYSAKGTDVTALLTQITNAEILIQKGHYIRALAIVHSAKKVAFDRESWGYANELIELERRLYNITRDKKMFDHIVSLNTEKKKLTNALENENKYIGLATEFIAMRNKQGSFFTASNMIKIKSLMNSELIKKDSKPVSILAKSNQLSLRTLYYELVKKDKLFYGAVFESYELYLKNPFAIRKNPFAFVQRAYNIMIALERQGKFKELYDFFEEVSHYEEKYHVKFNYKLKVLLLEMTMQSKLIYFYQTSQFEKGLDFLQIANKDIETHRKYISSEALNTFYFVAARLLIITTKYKEAVLLLNQILIFQESSFKKDESVISQYLLLIAHYELGNHDLMQFVKNNFKHQDPIDVMTFLSRQLPLISDRKKEKKVFIEFKKILLASKKRDFLQLYFDFLSWAESKIERITMADVLKKKQKNKTPHNRL